MTVELRKHPRVNTTLEITYYSKHTSNTEETDSTHYFATVTDLSKGGAGLLVDYPHRPNEEIWLEGIGHSNLPVPSIICWVRKLGRKYKIGIGFH